MNLLCEALAAYIITVVVTSSTLFAPVRAWIVYRTPRLGVLQQSFGPARPLHPIACRLCFGFWASCLVCVVMADYINILPVYGASYFMATQERK